MDHDDRYRGDTRFKLCKCSFYALLGREELASCRLERCSRGGQRARWTFASSERTGRTDRTWEIVFVCLSMFVSVCVRVFHESRTRTELFHLLEQYFLLLLRRFNMTYLIHTLVSCPDCIAATPVCAARVVKPIRKCTCLLTEINVRHLLLYFTMHPGPIVVLH